MGMSGILKSPVGQLCEEIDRKGKALRSGCDCLQDGLEGMQIIGIHAAMDSNFPRAGKGPGN